LTKEGFFSKIWSSQFEALFLKNMPLLPTDPRDRKAMLMGLRIAGDFGVAIAVPIIIFVLIGQWLEGKYGHAPWFTVVAFVISAVLSGISIYRKAQKYGQEFKDLDKK